MSKYQAAKAIVRNYFDAMEKATPGTVTGVLEAYVSKDYFWRGGHPFHEQRGAEAVAEIFWATLLKALNCMQRRQDIFIAGANEIGGEQWEIGRASCRERV